MTHKNKKIAIGVTLGVAAIGIGYMLYRRNENKQNASELLAFIDTLPKVNTSASQVTELDKLSANAINKINTTSASALNGKTLVFDGNGYVLGKDRDAITEKATAIVKQLYNAIDGVNARSNLSDFMKGFSRIGNNNAMVYMNILYKALYKETMWEAINSEYWLYTGNMKKADVFNLFDIPNYNRAITTHLETLK